MMKKHVKNLVMMILFIFFSAGASALDEPPVVLMIEAKGNVQYSADGQTWKKVSRNKFLFESWRVKTGKDGNCMLLNQQTEMLEPVNSNTEVEIKRKGTRVIRGSVSEPETARDIAGFLKRKFAKVQKYTSLTRYGRQDDNIRLETVEEITLSEDYPDLVWENAGPQCDYQVIVGKKFFEVPKSTDDVIRFPLHSLRPGQFKYTVQVLYDGEIVYAAQKKNNLRWLNDAEKASLRKEMQRIEDVASDNGFLLGNLLDERGLKIAAMDQYIRFLSQEPAADDIRPFLIRVLNELKLGGMEKKEIEKFHK